MGYNSLSIFKKRCGHPRSKGTVLILALWSLGILTVFAVNIAAGIRQKAILISRLEKRSQIRAVTEAGIRKAISVLSWENETYHGQYTAGGKILKHNNKDLFKQKEVGNGQFDVAYLYYSLGTGKIFKRYGFVDEESKINVNTVEASVLKMLIERVLSADEKFAQSLAQAISDWRKYGEGEVVGFFSDEFYENLQYPYEPKKGNFEVLEELLLVKGMTREIYEKLIHFITLYGDGKVNINTAPEPVLLALGLSEELANKILVVRRGPDEFEATEDDFIFQDAFTIADTLSQLAGLDPAEIKLLEDLTINSQLGINSYFYFLKSQGELFNSKQTKTIQCVYSTWDQKIVYWRED